jgi:hypothetical protein
MSMIYLHSKFKTPNSNSLLSKAIKLEAKYIILQKKKLFFLKSVPMRHINIPYTATLPLHKFTRLTCVSYRYLQSIGIDEVPVTANNTTSKNILKIGQSI